jgi:hypothetical protein
VGDQVPKLFVSATSADLHSSHQSVKEAILTLGCVPVEETNFPPDYRIIRDMLREKILGCDAVIHVVGECFNVSAVNGPSFYFIGERRSESKRRLCVPLDGLF